MENVKAENSHPVTAPNKSSRSFMVALILLLFLGFLGAHRFYVGKIGTAILFLFTAGAFGIWWWVDLIRLIIGSFSDKEGHPLKP